MLKNFLLLFFIAISPLTYVQAQIVHKIIFAHTTDKRIGESVESDLKRANNEIDEIGSNLNYEVKNYIYSGDECTKENLENVLSSLTVSNQDVVIFYYSGHGIHPNGALDDKWPQMCLNKPQFQDKFVSLRKVIETLTVKHALFTLILSDCCNSIDETGVVSIKGLLKSAGDATTITERTKQNYINLFTKYSGVLSITSSKLGQMSWCTKEDGGIFSFCFFNSLYENVSGTKTASWETILKDVTKSTISESNSKQEPMGDLSQLRYIGVTPPIVVNLINQPPTPVTPTPNPAFSTGTELGNAISTMLAETDKDKRLAQIPHILSKYFSTPKVTVLSMGRNLVTSVDYEEAEAFIRRIALVDNIVKINIIKEYKDANGKCSFLTIHEVRR